MGSCLNASLRRSEAAAMRSGGGSAVGIGGGSGGVRESAHRGRRR